MRKRIGRKMSDLLRVAPLSRGRRSPIGNVVLVAIAGWALLGAPAAQAVGIPIVNANFDNPQITTPNGVVYNIPAWKSFEPDCAASPKCAGIKNIPPCSNYPSQVGFLSLGSKALFVGSDAAISQPLGATWTVDTTYTLRMDFY